MTDVLVKKEKCENKGTHAGKRQVKAGVLLPQAKKLGARRQAWKRPSPRAFPGIVALPTLWSGTCNLQNHETTLFCCLNHSVCATFLQQPEQTNTAILCPLPFHMNFRSQVFYFYQKKSARIWTGIELNLQINLGRSNI